MDVRIIFSKESLRVLEDAPKAMHKAAVNAVRQAMIYVAKKSAREVGFSGPPRHLTSRTTGEKGLKGSIHASAEDRGDYIIGSLWSDCIYAPTHEYGAIIYPRKKKALSFEVDGKRVFAKKVIVPARPFLEPAVLNNELAINHKIQEIIYRDMG